MQYETKKSAFTLIELLVAMSIMVLMISVIDEVYTSTGKAVSQGIGVSHIIANNRGVSAQLKRDGDAMLGPSGKGILVIAYHKLDAYLNQVDPSAVKRPIRDDQILFLRSTSTIDQGVGTITAHPMMPANPSTYSYDPNYKSSAMLVWYGHAVRTSDIATLQTLGSGENSVASQWILGRQGMFLNTTGSTPTAGDLYANGPLPTSSLVGSWGGSIGSLANYQGTCDVADYGFKTIDPDNHGYLVGSTSTGTPPYLNADATMPPATYQQNAINLLYCGGQRLMVNPAPKYDASKPDYQMNAWQIAQMHGAVAMNVSDFQIAFAGDYTGPNGSGPPDGKIDRDDGPGGTGDIIWYTAPGYGNTTDGTVDAPSLLTTGPSPAYSPPSPSYTPYTTSITYSSGSGSAFVWRHDDIGGKYTNSNANQASLWPYLIRIRYRMHDSRGQVTSGIQGNATDKQAKYGMWFEQIIKVQRP